MKQIITKCLAVLVIIFLGIFLNGKYINEFPSHSHAWSQSDRYALSLGFVNNNLNFFKPETFALNPPDSTKANAQPPNSITAVEFPINDYIPAVFMKISGIHDVWIFRLYILLYSLVGLYFLFRLCYLLTDDSIKSIFVVVFAATSPVFAYFQSGFLPTIPCLSNVVIGMYFYLKYQEEDDQINFRLAVTFLTLAALSRITFAIPLIACLGLEFLKIIRGRSTLKYKALPVVSSILVIVLYHLYNSHLNKKYGTLFLNGIRPADSVDDAIEILGEVYNRWATVYFSLIHYLIIAGLILAVLVLAFFRKINANHVKGNFWALIGVLLFGCFAFTALMLHQFLDHDYYFLDTFFLPLILIVIAVLSYIPKLDGKYFWAFGIAGILLSIPIVSAADQSQTGRRNMGYWDNSTISINNFMGSEAFLDSLHIKKDARMLVLDGYSTNIPFILMNRKGYYDLIPTKENMESCLKWDYDYIVIQDEFFAPEIYAYYPEIVTRIKKIADNGKISVCTLLKEPTSQTLVGFLGLKDKTPVFERTMTFDTIADKEWENTEFTSKVFNSPPNAGYVTPDKEFGITFKTTDLPAITEKKRILLFSGYFYEDSLKNCEVVVSIDSADQNVYYEQVELNGILKKINDWEKTELVFSLPRIDSDDYEFKIFIHNSGGNEMYIDDFSFKMY